MIGKNSSMIKINQELNLSIRMINELRHLAEKSDQ